MSGHSVFCATTQHPNAGWNIQQPTAVILVFHNFGLHRSCKHQWFDQHVLWSKRNRSRYSTFLCWLSACLTGNRNMIELSKVSVHSMTHNLWQFYGRGATHFGNPLIKYQFSLKGKIPVKTSSSKYDFYKVVHDLIQFWLPLETVGMSSNKALAWYSSFEEWIITNKVSEKEDS